MIKMVREIVQNKIDELNQWVIVVHRYNQRDDTFIEYFTSEKYESVFKNVWISYGHTRHYNKQ